MKKAIIFCLVIAVIPISGFAQSLENLDYISPFHDGVAAIKKDSLWAFINEKGALVINFRNDLFVTHSSAGNYPIFYDERCIIEQKKQGVSYFGYIDTSGKTVIEPRFLNATNFNNGLAITLKLHKDIVTKNTALDKEVVYYSYFQVIIDTGGNVKNYITQKGVNVVLDKDFLRKPPAITSKQISENLYALKTKNKKWKIINIVE